MPMYLCLDVKKDGRVHLWRNNTTVFSSGDHVLAATSTAEALREIAKLIDNEELDVE